MALDLYSGTVKNRRPKDEGVREGAFLRLKPKTLVCGGYSVERVIAKGDEARILKVKKGSKSFAAKQLINYSGDTNTYFSTFIIREIDLLTRLKHPNIMYAIDSDFFPLKDSVSPIVCIIGELMDGDLSSFVGSSSEKIDVWLKVLRGVEYLHTNFVIHCDIKPQNIFFRRSNQASKVEVKIGDYGGSIITGSSRKVPYPHEVGTVIWLAPELAAWDAYNEVEILIDRKDFFYGNEIDIFSLGVVGLELMFGIEPIEDNSLPMTKRWERGSIIPEDVFRMKTSPKNNSEAFYERILKSLKLSEKGHTRASKEMRIMRDMIGVCHKRPNIHTLVEKFERLYRVKKSSLPTITLPLTETKSLSGEESIRPWSREERERVILINVEIMRLSGMSFDSKDQLEFVKGILIESLDIYDRCGTHIESFGVELVAKISLFIAMAVMNPDIGIFHAFGFSDQDGPILMKVLESFDGRYFRPTLDQMGELSQTEYLCFLREHSSPSLIKV
jgi:serine/threonine protein kinase